MTDDERTELDEALGTYAIECLSTGNMYSQAVMVARGAIAVLVDGMLKRHDTRVKELERKIDNLELYGKRLATRNIQLEQKLITAERQIQQYENQ